MDFFGGPGGTTGALVDNANKALTLQRQMYDTNEARSIPYLKQGTKGLNVLSSLLGQKFEPSRQDAKERLIAEGRYPMSENASEGLKNQLIDAELSQMQAEAEEINSGSDFGRLTKDFTLEDFEADPGYNFRQTEGQKAIDRIMAASGKTYTPEAVKSLSDYNSGLASQEFGQAFNRDNIQDTNIFNRFASLAGIGQNAVAQLQPAAMQYGNVGSELYQQIGNAEAAGQAAKSAARGSMFNTLLKAGTSAATAGMSSAGSAGSGSSSLWPGFKQGSLRPGETINWN
jgi:hypothetical protein